MKLAALFVTLAGLAGLAACGKATPAAGVDAPIACTPFAGTCNGNISHQCTADGSGYVDVDCDPVQGETCGPSGLCEGMCAATSLGSSYIGCEYYPTVTGNLVTNDFDFAIAIANTTATSATVTIEDGALTAATTVTVAANSVVVENLPWQTALKLCNENDDATCEGVGAQVAKGAYHVRSNVPVTVYQFNALEYELNNGAEFSYTNDASLMLPTNTWGSAYYVASYPGQVTKGTNGPPPPTASELAVTAALDHTTVTINARAATLAGGGAPAFAAGSAQSVTLDAGDVLEITTLTGDLTGSYVTSDKPIQVIGGHVCADVPDNTVAGCDHLEESMLSVAELGQDYLINAPTVSTNLAAKVEVIRIIAAAPNVHLTYDPPQTNAPATITNAGDFIAITGNSQSFLIHADQKVMVVQYLEGQDAGGAYGDPAMTLAVPVEQFRKSYLFHAPLSYQSNYIDISGPTGAQVTLDGGAVTLNALETTGYAVARKALTTGPAADGNHSISSDMPIGIQVYGYGQYTAYWYPGGLDLMSITIE